MLPISNIRSSLLDGPCADATQHCLAVGAALAPPNTALLWEQRWRHPCRRAFPPPARSSVSAPPRYVTADLDEGPDHQATSPSRGSPRWIRLELSVVDAGSGVDAVIEAPYVAELPRPGRGLSGAELVLTTGVSSARTVKHGRAMWQSSPTVGWRGWFSSSAPRLPSGLCRGPPRVRGSA
jgi:hypothetical protein